MTRPHPREGHEFCYPLRPVPLPREPARDRFGHLYRPLKSSAGHLSIDAGAKAANNAKRLVPCPESNSQAGWECKRVTAMDRHGAEVALDRPVAGRYDSDRKPPVVDLDVIRHLQGRGVEELQDVVLEQADLA